MINKIVEGKNLNRAYQRVYRNRGSSGFDGLSVVNLKAHLQVKGAQYRAQIVSGTYQVNPILGKAIPKANGKKRLLGIPTVVDRVIQQAIVEVL